MEEGWGLVGSDDQGVHLREEVVVFLMDVEGTERTPK